MRKNLLVGLGVFAALFVSQNCFAAIMVSLLPTPSGDPVILAAGESITIDVVVSGIGGASLDFLGVTVLFDSALLGVASTTDSQISIFDASYFAPDFENAERGGPINIQVLGSTMAPVPEPSSLAIFSLGVPTVWFLARRRKKRVI